LFQLNLLKVGLYGLGIGAIAIGLSMFLFGPDITGRFFAEMLASVGGRDQSLTGLSGPDVDSELRFYSVFWIAYGVFVLKAARALPEHIGRAQILLALFLLGGIGRVLSHVTIGAPHALFSVLMWIELALPILLIGLSLMVKRR